MAWQAPAPSCPRAPQCCQHLCMAAALLGTWHDTAPRAWLHLQVQCHAMQPWCGIRASAPSFSPAITILRGLQLCAQLPPSSLQQLWGSCRASRAQPTLGPCPALLQNGVQGCVPRAHSAHPTHAPAGVTPGSYCRPLSKGMHFGRSKFLPCPLPACTLCQVQAGPAAASGSDKCTYSTIPCTRSGEPH